MHQKSELTRVQLEQFKRDRWPYVIGHLGATAAVVGVAWPTADHGALVWFALAHHISTWILAFTFFAPFRSGTQSKIPLSTYAGTAVCNATLSSALLFDLTAAHNLDFTLTVGTTLFAGAAGSFVTLGVHSTVMRVALASLLLPYALITLFLGHIAIALGVVFFFCNVVIAGVWKTAIGNRQLIAMHLNESHRAARAELEAETDPLTGLMNRRGIQRLDGAALGARATALYLDVNDFKAINDTYGHTAGDEVLRVIAQRLRETVPARDVVARVGGDEFLVLSFSDDEGSIEAIVRNVQEQMQQPIVVALGNALHVSIAAGVAYSKAPTVEVAELLRESDRAMYRAKRATQNEQTGVDQADLDRFAA